jgi:hypothetical protein
MGGGGSVDGGGSGAWGRCTAGVSTGVSFAGAAATSALAAAESLTAVRLRGAGFEVACSGSAAGAGVTSGTWIASSVEGGTGDALGGG